ncbi:hypothetical protein MG293_011908 [Ovis ammon polii]|uniref:Uncharacterized protein n=1 Tax=Ovis ammon polii TaxID=230172 RepID=A0AAD4U7J6_OVIAM|nr:hypothetical protein MG293_011908 [Ovis ammon polii]KAI4562690.1 hypothetical protein MJT46_011652 [Ovis ammon polii x Ovis aries]
MSSPGLASLDTLTCSLNTLSFVYVSLKMGLLEPNERQDLAQPEERVSMRTENLKAVPEQPDLCALRKGHRRVAAASQNEGSMASWPPRPGLPTGILELWAAQQASGAADVEWPETRTAAKKEDTGNLREPGIPKPVWEPQGNLEQEEE